MPGIQFTDNSPEGKKRQELIAQVLPEKPIVEEFLQPRLMEAMEDVLVKSLKKEIEIYKAYPKSGKYDMKTFDTRSPDRCFMGQGFKWNGVGAENWTDAELQEYRRRIGTLAHMEWGDVTLLEVWGGDHFEQWPEMVQGVMRYCWGERKTLPDIQFHVNPFFKNKVTGKMVLSADMQADNTNREHLYKIAAYLEIRDRLKKAGTDKVMHLGATEEDDPKPDPNKDWEEEDDDE